MARVLNRNQSYGWGQAFLEAVVEWALRELGCVGRYEVSFPEARRPLFYKGRAWPRKRVVKVWLNRDCHRGRSEMGWRCPGYDPRLPELREWMSSQPTLDSSEELLCWLLGHELFHCEDQFSCKSPFTRKSAPVEFVVMEQRCDEAGFALVRAWRAGGRETVVLRAAEIRARLEREPMAATASGGHVTGTVSPRPGSLAAAREMLRRAQG